MNHHRYLTDEEIRGLHRHMDFVEKVIIPIIRSDGAIRELLSESSIPVADLCAQIQKKVLKLQTRNH